MEKNTLTTFLWVVVTVIIMLALVAFAAPFGMYVKNNIEVFSNDVIVEEPENELYESESHNITIQYRCANCGAGSGCITHPATVIRGVAGTVYNVTNPEITGYTPVKGRVTKGVYGEKDETIVVEYEPNTYLINYELDGWEFAGSYKPPISYVYKHESTVMLPDMSKLFKEHYTTEGKWYTSKLFTEDYEVNSVKTDVPYDQTFYWGGTKGEDYKIFYHLNDNFSEPFYTHCGNATCVNKGTHAAKWTGDAPSETYTYGIQTTLTTNVEKLGYTFKGWSTSAETFIPKTQINEIDNGTIHVYAHWEKKTYTIDYVMDFKIGGNGSRAEEEVTAEFNTEAIDREYTYTESTRNGKIVLPNANKIKPLVDKKGKAVGFHFGANIWKDKDGKEVVHLPNSGDCHYPIGDIKLYINPIVNTYTIIYNNNVPSAITNAWGYTNVSAWASGTMSNQTLKWNEKNNLSENGFSITGYTFAGWATSKTGSKKYDNKAEVTYLVPTNNGTYNLYALWTQNTNLTVTIKYHYQTEAASFNNQTALNSTNFIESGREVQTINNQTVNTNFAISDYKKTVTGFSFHKATATVKNNTKEITNTVWISPDGLEINIYYLRNKNTVNVYINRRDAFENLKYKITYVDSSGTTRTLANTTTLEGNYIYNNVDGTKHYTITNVPYNTSVQITHKVRSKCYVSKSNLTLKANNKDVSMTYTESGQSGTASFSMPSATTNYYINAEFHTAKIKFVIGTNSFPINLSFSEKTKKWGEVIPFPTVSSKDTLSACEKMTYFWTDKNGDSITPTSKSPTVAYEMLNTTTTYYVYASIAPDSHDYKKVTVKHATCTRAGQKDYICSKCGDNNGKAETIPALGHKMSGETATYPNHCDVAGKIEKKCTRNLTCNIGSSCGCAGKCTYKETTPINAQSHCEDGMSQCDKVHNEDHDYLINMYGHTCTTGENVDAEVSNCCWRHVICGRTLRNGIRCRHNLNEKFCMTHGTGTEVAHGVTGCKKYSTSGQSHKCKTHAYRTEVDTLPCPNSSVEQSTGTCGVCRKRTEKN